LNITSSNGSIAIGNTSGNFASAATGTNAISVGINSTAGGTNSSAFGYNNTASGACSVASGYLNTASGLSSSAFGYGSSASGLGSSASGYLNTASGACSVAFGRANTSCGSASSAFGYGSSASGDNSSAFGRANTASGNYASAFGHNNTASVLGSSAFGRLNTASGVRSSASGYLNTASGGDSSAFGYQNTASGACSVAFGRANTASGNYASAFGYGSSASGACSVAFGRANTSCGSASSAFGYGSSASGNYSLAVGYNNTAPGACSVASGNRNTSCGSESSAFGYNNTASGACSVAFGYSNTACGSLSSVFGNSITNTIATSTMIGPSNTSKVTILSSGRVGLNASTTPAGSLGVAQVANDQTGGVWIAASDGDYRSIWMNTSQVLNFEGGSGNTATLTAAGAWTNAPSFSYLKQDRDVLSKAKLLEIFASTTIETFKVISDVENFGAGADTQLGIVLDEAHSLLSDRDINGNITGYSPIRTAAAAFGGVQLLTNIINIQNATTSSPTLSIDANQNVGIGTTTPSYRLHVMGDVAATAFVNTSTRNSKTDISYLEERDYENFLNKLSDINIATYRYNMDGADAPINRLGLIAEESPSEVLSTAGDGVDIYKLATFTLGATKAQYEKIKGLDVRVAELEARGGGHGNSSLSDVIAGLENLGARFMAGIARFKNVFVESLTIGSPAKPSGITLYDEVTGEPYCLKIANGQTLTIQGTCTVSSGASDSEEDTEAPVITLNGNNPATIDVGTSYVDLGASVTDNKNNNLGITVDGDHIDTTVPGMHTIIYSATDQAGNTGTTTRTVIVKDPYAQEETEETPVEEVPEEEVIDTQEEVGGGNATTTEEVILPPVENPIQIQQGGTEQSTSTSTSTSTPQ